MNRRYEIGEMAETMDRFSDSLGNEVVGNLKKLAEGDLTFKVTLRDGQGRMSDAKAAGNDPGSMLALDDDEFGKY